MRAADWTTQEKVVLPDTDLSSLLQEGELSLELEGSRSQVTELQERVEELQAETEAQDKALRLVHWSGVHQVGSLVRGSSLYHHSVLGLVSNGCVVHLYSSWTIIIFRHLGSASVNEIYNSE